MTISNFVSCRVQFAINISAHRDWFVQRLILFLAPALRFVKLNHFCYRTSIVCHFSDLYQKIIKNTCISAHNWTINIKQFFLPLLSRTDIIKILNTAQIQRSVSKDKMTKSMLIHMTITTSVHHDWVLPYIICNNFILALEIWQRISAHIVPEINPANNMNSLWQRLAPINCIIMTI